MKVEPLLRAVDVRREFRVRGDMSRRLKLAAVDKVSLDVLRGETLGIVGESGCGKSTLARLLVGLLSPTTGTIEFAGQELPRGRAVNRPNRDLRRRLQIVFQDPFSSLNPWMTVAQALERPLRLHAVGDATTRERRVQELLAAVGLPSSAAGKLPHQFSGGQRQRIAIARSLATGPELIVADEVTSSLDVSVQATILNLLRDLQSERGLTYVVISHDMRVIRHMCDRVAVMYLGRIVEQAPTEQLFEDPKHPYTRLLLGSVPDIAPSPDETRPAVGRVSGVVSPLHRPAGCAFHPRCSLAIEPCRSADQELVQVGENHDVACQVMSSAGVKGQNAAMPH